ncbi:hypothetical protein EVAR_76994_1 [Eumeta japonica]|uniref:Uncharacterized protein n=1 Tax=Eumeta variegata TaxID=151549 RepID=A0A4C1SHC3_EUMVA|nr:hypothetical protein EVAR_76994_1 [Eumeta japonica]
MMINVIELSEGEGMREIRPNHLPQLHPGDLAGGRERQGVHEHHAPAQLLGVRQPICVREGKGWQSHQEDQIN